MRLITVVYKCTEPDAFAQLVAAIMSQFSDTVMGYPR